MTPHVPGTGKAGRDLLAVIDSATTKRRTTADLRYRGRGRYSIVTDHVAHRRGFNRQTFYTLADAGLLTVDFAACRVELTAAGRALLAS